MQKLEEIRAKIDEVDEKMAELFAMRMELVSKAGEWKRAHPEEWNRAKGDEVEIEDKEREEEIIANNSKRFEGDLKEDYVRFQKTVIEISKNNERRDA